MVPAIVDKAKKDLKERMKVRISLNIFSFCIKNRPTKMNTKLNYPKCPPGSKRSRMRRWAVIHTTSS